MPFDANMPFKTTLKLSILSLIQWPLSKYEFENMVDYFTMSIGYLILACARTFLLTTLPISGMLFGIGFHIARKRKAKRILRQQAEEELDPWL